jgi:hypothetical protein
MLDARPASEGPMSCVHLPRAFPVPQTPCGTFVYSVCWIVWAVGRGHRHVYAYFLFRGHRHVYAYFLN